MSELKKQTISGVKWLVGSSFLQKGIQLIATVILARILGPAEFGLFALAFIAIEALGLFKSMGFDSALIQRKGDIEKAANTVFFIMPFLGIVMYLILALSAPLIGKFMNNQDVVGVIKALGLIFIFSCLGKVPSALMEKNMQFKKVSIIELSSIIIYSLAAIILAFFKMGIWSLVVAYILKTLNSNILFWVFSKWRPRFEFDKKIALEMFHFGKFLFLGGVVMFLKMNLDNVLVGKLLGIATLGLYGIAFNISNFCSDYFGAKAYRVVYPAYSKLQSDIYDLRAAILKTLKYISIIAIPFGAFIFLFSKELLLLIYGEKWIEGSGVLKILVFAGIFNTLPAGMGAALLAYGKARLAFWIITIQVILFFIFIAPMARLFGINGVGIIVSATGILTFIITTIWSMKLFFIKLSDIYLRLKTALFSSLIMILAVILFKNLLLQTSTIRFYNYNLIIAFIISPIIYIFSLSKLENATFKELKGMIL